MASVNLRAPVQGIVIALEAAVGQAVAAGRPVVVIESMKMEVPVEAPFSGRLTALHVAVGDTVAEGEVLAFYEPAPAVPELPAAATPPAPAPHPELATLATRREALADSARPEAAGRRHDAGGRTVRENLADLLDPASFTEYGALAVAAQRTRRPLDELIAQTPADGLVTGIGTVNAADFGPERARCAVMAYDYSVLAGTQGVFNHMKSDRLLELAGRATSTGPSSPAWTARPSPGGQPCPARCLAWASLPAAASRAMRHCSAART